MLVLGREKEGVPVELLNEADIVCEIPQLGLVRSLNVRTSCEMFLVEYTRQRAQRERDRAAAAAAPAAV